MNETQPKTILVVDDDPNVVLALQKRLTHAGYRVLTALTGEDALASARGEQVDAITLDVAMAGAFNGLEVAEFLRQDVRTASIPTLFVTGTADARFKEKCEAAGGTYFFSKPYDADLLIRVLKGLFASDELGEVQRLSRAKRRQPAC